MTAKRKPASGRTENRTLERIREALEVLRLPRMLRSLDEVLADPREDLSRPEWLWLLLEPQLRERLENRVERRIRASRLPARKTLGAFDFDFQPKLDRDLVRELATLRFMDQAGNVLLAGMSGTGKSHMAMALALAACVDDRWVRSTTSEKMLGTLNAALADDSLERALKQSTKPELLVVDEVGLEQVERTVASRAGLMQKVLLPRHEQRSTIVTSNIPWESWGEYLGDHLGAAALLDRLLHHSHVIVIDGPSDREHEHRQEVSRPHGEPSPAKARGSDSAEAAKPTRAQAPAGRRKRTRKRA
jgi:DNA replication protein DnaC